ncbi:hypothetical protein PHJA_000159500 [Phtheirospermum japonicum]|uniref:Uncharacterized protein n=1 Tax=Phtheirospermum japonicum TaxID=374723 RepID=A0A830BDJ6_9LAMI|nr:hypothetical protein PHJA_000159500 [Phtheirospermum japonicum]
MEWSGAALLAAGEVRGRERSPISLRPVHRHLQSLQEVTAAGSHREPPATDCFRRRLKRRGTAGADSDLEKEEADFQLSEKRSQSGIWEGRDRKEE